MCKLLRMALFTLPLAGGAAWAQGSGTSGSAGAPGTTVTPRSDDDTRTPMQRKAGAVDDTTPALPGDATRPEDIPNTVRDSDRSAMPDTRMTTPGTTTKKAHKKVHSTSKTDESRIERKSDVDHDTTRIENKAEDMTRDQLNSDK